MRFAVHRHQNNVENLKRARFDMLRFGINQRDVNYELARNRIV